MLVEQLLERIVLGDGNIVAPLERVDGHQEREYRESCGEIKQREGARGEE